MVQLKEIFTRIEHFNSSMVQLKVKLKIDYCNFNQLFQFLDGTIKRVNALNI